MGKIYLAIKDNGMKAIPLSSILAIEAQDHYASIHYICEEKVENLFVFAKLGDFEKSLPSSFIRVGRSQIINTRRVLKANGNELKFAETYVLRLKTKASLKFFYSELSLTVKKK